MSLDLARTLVLTEVVAWGPVAQALFVSATRGVPFVRALLDADALTLDRLEEELARADVPVATTVNADPALIERLPRGMCGRFFAVPLRAQGERTDGTIDVAFADARDAHAARELSHHLGAPIRVLRAPFAKIEEAVSRLPSPRQQDVMESTLVSVRAPEGIPEPSSERDAVASSRSVVAAPAAAPPPAPSPSPSPSPAPAAVATSAAPAAAPAQTPSAPPLPLVRRATDEPIPLVRRAEEQPVIELRSPYSRQPVRVEIAAAAAMRSAQTRDEILRLLLEGISEYAKRVVLFAVRKEGFTGLLCSPTMGDEARIRDVRVAAEGPSIFFNVSTGGTYVGPLYAAPAHKPLFALLPNMSEVVVVTAVRLRGRPLVVALAEGLGSPAQEARYVEELARAAGDAFARILAAKGE